MQRSSILSPIPLSTASLTCLKLVCRTPGLHNQPLLALFHAAFTTQLQQLQLDFYCGAHAHVVPVAALPPHLTALICAHAILQLDGNVAGVPDTPSVEASRAATAADAASSTSHGAVWDGLQRLQTLQMEHCIWAVTGSTPNVFGRGGRLPDLLQRTPNLKRLVFRQRPTSAFLLGSAGDAARLRGCCQMLTHLEMTCRDFHAAEERHAEAEQLCEWVGSLRHLRQLHLDSSYVPGPLLPR
jgi:hypothetical protein